MTIKEISLVSKLHLQTKRNYLERMRNNKIHCMKISKRFDKNYWDGERKYGYGGYKYIKGRWKNVAKGLIQKFKLNKKSKILDLGCGKGYLLYEIKKIIPEIKIVGIDISRYAIRNSHPQIKENLFFGDAAKKLKFKKKEFDLLISIGCLHNLEIDKLFFSLKEIKRISKKQYILVESYRNEDELFNLQCWALTCESFFSKNEWIWILKKNNLSGFYEFIYFS
tara:strand:- start:14983 stop:15651 length:669 start_codon:yes stop_codon:yes gene_type:complete